MPERCRRSKAPNRSLEAARLAIDSAEVSVPNARASRLPQIDLSSTVAQSLTEMSFTFSALRCRIRRRQDAAPAPRHRRRLRRHRRLTDNPEDVVTSLEYLLRVGRFVVAAAVYLAGLVPASAQTVIVQNAGPGSTAEFVLNGTVVATGTAGADGLATLTAGQGALADRGSVDVFVWVDRCGAVRRVVVVDRLVTPPPAGGECSRSQIAGLFLLQRVTTMVVDVEREPPSMRLRQGPAPAEWLIRPAPGAAAAASTSLAPRGLGLFGGLTRSWTTDFSNHACGDAPTCNAEDQVFGATGGVAFWPVKYVGVEVSLVRPRKVVVDGSGEGYEFDSEMDGGLLLFAGKVGAPIGRVRLFGMGGLNYHRATFTTVQDINDASQTYQWRTRGWGPAFGGGAEVWFSPRIGVYGELTRAMLKGDDVGGGEAKTDAGMTSIVAGLRLWLFGD